jgi:hypothetical protein
VLRLGMMKHLAKIAIVEVLSTNGAMLEMLRLVLDWLVVVLVSISRASLLVRYLDAPTFAVERS